MKKIILSNEYISAFCLQVVLLLHAGINLADGVHMLAEDETDDRKAWNRRRVCAVIICVICGEHFDGPFVRCIFL